MQTIGLIGGMSWESTAIYYRVINQEVARRRGGLCSAPLHLISLNFEEVAELQKIGSWRSLGAILSDAAERLHQAGAKCIVICTNTMHMVAPDVSERVRLPLIHITDVTAKEAVRAGFNVVGLLGTRFTMESTFYADRLAAYGIDSLLPSTEDRAEVHRIIFEELCRGVIKPSSRDWLLGCIDRLQRRGAQAVALACTELPMLMDVTGSSVPVLDTTQLHALAAAEFCLL